MTAPDQVCPYSNSYLWMLTHFSKENNVSTDVVMDGEMSQSSITGSETHERQR